MTRKLPPSASVAKAVDGIRLHAPAAERNAEILCNLLRSHAPQQGEGLEIASGTGQHIVAFAKAVPDVIWQPTDIELARISSIRAYVNETSAGNIRPPQKLDATRAGWAQNHGGKNVIVLVNLLHLISTSQAKTVLGETIAALSQTGRFILYGPFKRDGRLTSPGDVRFDTELRAADAGIGYKNDADVVDWLRQAGAGSVTRVELPANNLALVSGR